VIALSTSAARALPIALVMGASLGAGLFVARASFAAKNPPLDTSQGIGHAPAEWTPLDYLETWKLGEDIRSSGPDLLLIMDSESGLHPGARFPKTDAAGHALAVGISQLTSASDALTGLSESERDALSQKSVAEQLPIVRRYFEREKWTALGRPYPTAGVLYAMNFLPARALARGVAPDTILGTVEEFPLDSHLADSNGNYTVRSLEHYLAAGPMKSPRYLGALQAMRDAVGDQSLSPRLAA
jgi:hypothetical protein